VACARSVYRLTYPAVIVILYIVQHRDNKFIINILFWNVRRTGFTPLDLSILCPHNIIHIFIIRHVRAGKYYYLIRFTILNIVAVLIYVYIYVYRLVFYTEILCKKKKHICHCIYIYVITMTPYFSLITLNTSTRY